MTAFAAAFFAKVKKTVQKVISTYENINVVLLEAKRGWF